MAAADNQSQSPQRRRLLLLHRFPTFEPSFLRSLYTNFTVLDPVADPPHPSFSILSKSVRVMLCVGPTPVTSDDLDRYPAVEFLVGSSAGVNHVDLDACRRRGIRVTSAGDVFSDDVADYAVGLVIDVLRRVSAADRFVRASSWAAGETYAVASKVSGKRVGIVGLGSIGSRVAKRLEAFGCRVSYKSRKMYPHVSYTYYTTILDLASNNDVLIICCALTDETYHVVNKDVMTALGKTGVLVNIGRGALVDEKELVGFLVRGEIGGAGLDVFEHEPHVPNELFELDNVVLSPHVAVFTPESFTGLGELIMSNLEAFFSDKHLKAEISLE
ncbi:glyoxylate/hydroxypyruvate reductase HPR3-like [Henckelia pumila]|uniref:glyoxylate/hydroxypyruvate reductase HPR3-like n=1 Tax=Henckelia pumila TaxID=405737 RepID=UPI003C6E5F84